MARFVLASGIKRSPGRGDAPGLMSLAELPGIFRALRLTKHRLVSFMRIGMWGGLPGMSLNRNRSKIDFNSLGIFDRLAMSRGV
jgi:hypothetical protein